MSSSPPIDAAPRPDAPRAGRPRDDEIDRRVLDQVRRQLADAGYEALSVAAVAAAAGTTRAAIYRRWPDKADLATAAIAALPEAAAQPPHDHPFDDLVAELDAFRRGVVRPDGLPMVGTMLLGTAEPVLVDRYRERIVRPRRARLRAILERARDDGALDEHADLELAVTMCTGSWYAAALAGVSPPADWPRRVATLVWRACGGQPPTAQTGTAQLR
jgi:AcrR family transcriptional regulator